MSENKQQTAAPNKNAVVEYKSGLVKTQETFINMISKNAQEMALKFDDYQISCAKNALSKMVELLWKEGLTIKDVNQDNVTDILQQVAMLKLNLSAIPREGYISFRNVNIKDPNNEKGRWVKVFEFNIEGDGNDRLLRSYGVGVQKVHNCWLVREGDEFTYSSFDGLSVVPPKWSPKGYTNKVIRVVYPIVMEDGQAEYHIAEREGVAVNLQAHIINNIKMLKDEKMPYAKKQEIMKRIATMSLETMLSDEELRGIISPAWRDPHSQEAMIVRKMRNNATRKIPKDFSSSFISGAYEKTFEDYEQYEEKPVIDQSKVVDAEVDELAGSEKIDVQIIDKSVNETVEAEVVDVPVQSKQEGKASKPKNAPF